MSILRKRMIEDMQLRGFSPRTQQSYSRAVRKLAQHYHKSPDLVTDEELRQYFLYRTNVSRWSRVACTIPLCGIKFFYEKTLKRDWTTIGLSLTLSSPSSSLLKSKFQALPYPQLSPTPTCSRTLQVRCEVFFVSFSGIYAYDVQPSPPRL